MSIDDQELFSLYEQDNPIFKLQAENNITFEKNCVLTNDNIHDEICIFTDNPKPKDIEDSMIGFIKDELESSCVPISRDESLESDIFGENPIFVRDVFSNGKQNQFAIVPGFNKVFDQAEHSHQPILTNLRLQNLDFVISKGGFLFTNPDKYKYTLVINCDLLIFYYTAKQFMGNKNFTSWVTTYHSDMWFLIKLVNQSDNYDVFVANYKGRVNPQNNLKCIEFILLFGYNTIWQKTMNYCSRSLAFDSVANSVDSYSGDKYFSYYEIVRKTLGVINFTEIPEITKLREKGFVAGIGIAKNNINACFNTSDKWKAFADLFMLTIPSLSHIQASNNKGECVKYATTQASLCNRIINAAKKFVAKITCCIPRSGGTKNISSDLVKELYNILKQSIQLITASPNVINEIESLLCCILKFSGDSSHLIVAKYLKHILSKKVTEQSSKVIILLEERPLFVRSVNIQMDCLMKCRNLLSTYNYGGKMLTNKHYLYYTADDSARIQNILKNTYSAVEFINYFIKARGTNADTFYSTLLPGIITNPNPNLVSAFNIIIKDPRVITIDFEDEEFIQFANFIVQLQEFQYLKIFSKTLASIKTVIQDEQTLSEYIQSVVRNENLEDILNSLVINHYNEGDQLNSINFFKKKAGSFFDMQQAARKSSRKDKVNIKELCIQINKYNKNPQYIKGSYIDKVFQITSFLNVLGNTAQEILSIGVKGSNADEVKTLMYYSVKNLFMRYAETLFTGNLSIFLYNSITKVKLEELIEIYKKIRIDPSGLPSIYNGSTITDRYNIIINTILARQTPDNQLIFIRMAMDYYKTNLLKDNEEDINNLSATMKMSVKNEVLHSLEIIYNLFKTYYEIRYINNTVLINTDIQIITGYISGGNKKNNKKIIGGCNVDNINLSQIIDEIIEYHIEKFLILYNIGSFNFCNIAAIISFLRTKVYYLNFFLFQTGELSFSQDHIKVVELLQSNPNITSYFILKLFCKLSINETIHCFNTREKTLIKILYELLDTQNSFDNCLFIDPAYSYQIINYIIEKVYPSNQNDPKKITADLYLNILKSFKTPEEQTDNNYEIILFNIVYKLYEITATNYPKISSEYIDLYHSNINNIAFLSVELIDVSSGIEVPLIDEELGNQTEVFEYIQKILIGGRVPGFTPEDFTTAAPTDKSNYEIEVIDSFFTIEGLRDPGPAAVEKVNDTLQDYTIQGGEREMIAKFVFLCFQIYSAAIGDLDPYLGATQPNQRIRQNAAQAAVAQAPQQSITEVEPPLYAMFGNQNQQQQIQYSNEEQLPTWSQGRYEGGSKKRSKKKRQIKKRKSKLRKRIVKIRKRKLRSKLKKKRIYRKNK